MKFSKFNFNKYEFYLIISGFILFSLIISIFIIFTEPINDSTNNYEVRISKGATLTEIANLLHKNNQIHNKKFFIFLTKIKSRQIKLRSGFYDIKGIKSYNQLINLLSKGQNFSTKVTIPEGSTIKEIAIIISKNVNINPQLFQKLCFDTSFIKKLNLSVNSLEGYLFPDTYFFYKNDLEESIIKKMIDNFLIKWNKIDQNIKINSGKSQNKILTLASLIEGECIIDIERPIVSSLYQNRLRRRLKLEADPTIQYIIPDAPRRLLLKDLEIKSPYNTYKNVGLPPGPVNNPGIKSILAALSPAQTNYIYMVAKGDGSHHFTKSYNSFLRAKRKFQKVRRKIKEQN